jgi:5'-nucleotidase/UDP-sugar diphosphatase
MNIPLPAFLERFTRLGALLTLLGSGTASAAPTVVTDHAQYLPGETIVATFTEGPGNLKDWIGVYPEGVTPGSVGSTIWFYTDGTKSGTQSRAAGTVTFPGGLTGVGPWTAYFLLNDGYEILAETAFSVVDATTPLARVAKPTYAPGEKITVNFNNAPGNPKDWIAFYKAGQTPGSVGSTAYLYVDGTTSGTTAVLTGSVDFPAGLASPGDYVVYLLENDGYTVLASENFKVAVPLPSNPELLSITPASGATAVPPVVNFAASIANGTTQVAEGSLVLKVDGAPVTPVIQTASGRVNVSYALPGLQPAGSVHAYELTFKDNANPANTYAFPGTFRIGSYQDIVLPAPLYFENFDQVAEGTLPAGWTEQSFSVVNNPDFDLGNLDSASYAKWTVVDVSRFAGTFITYSDPENPAAWESDYQRVLTANPFNVVNGAALTGPIASGRMLFGNSGYRNGASQVLYTFTPDYNLTGQRNVTVSFHSLWEQNQDSLAAFEYSTDQGATWHPIAYFIDGADVVRDETGKVDAVATFTTARGDIARYTDAEGNEAGGSYGAFIGAPITQDLARFIQARNDDNPSESKRVERYRLPLADHQATVRFRFAHAGTDSWYWGVDNFGIYAAASQPFAGFVNKGLVAVGRLSSSQFDKAGNGQQDTLGGFSAMAVDPATLTYLDGKISGRLIGLPDRGFGDGTTDYRPRLEQFDFTITPYYGVAPVGQNQIVFNNTDTLLFTYDNGKFFTGFDGGNTNNPVVPQSPATSVGGGRRSLDAEGLVLAPDGGYWVSDEYGPALFRFNAAGELQETILPPAALVPKVGAFPGVLNFNGTTLPTSGRRNNRGLEGLTLSPDGKRLVAALQSPTVQDGGAGNLGRNTRILEFDVEPGSPTRGKVVSERIYQLTLKGDTNTTRHTPVSELLAVSPTTFLSLERDGIGLGVAPGVASQYKQIVLVETTGASNLAGTAYDLERGAPGQKSLPTTGTALPAGLSATARQDFVNLIDPVQLAKFGLNAQAAFDQNTISEKWEALSLIPLQDAANPDDYLLLVGNDNDFFAPITYHNGQPVGTNATPVDLMLLAYRVTIPKLPSAAPANVPPTVAFTLPSGTTYASGALPLTAEVADADGLVIKVEFFDGATKLGELTQFPWVFLVAAPTVGDHTYRIVVTDQSGATSETSKAVTVTAGNLPPTIALTSPAANLTVSAPFNVAFTVSTADTDGFVTKVDYFNGATKVGTSTNAPFNFTLSNAPVGTLSLTAVATDNLGATTTSSAVTLTVNRAAASDITLQILHASDFEAGIAALDDAPRFSSVVNALKSDFPTHTLVLASGDNYIPGPFFTASADPAAPFNGIKGRADIVILNALGVQASCFGNHEFDDNTPQVRSLILPDAVAGYPGTAFPYLSANLDFSTDSSMASLVTADGQEASAMKNKVAKSAIITVGGQKVGVVGGTVTDLKTISSPGNIGVSQNLAADIQAAVDRLLALGVNKVVVMTHLQQFGREFQLATQLRDVDVIIAGGSHSVFAKPTDRLRPEDTVASPYPTSFVGADGKPVHVVNTGSSYRYVGRLIVSFNAAGEVTVVDNRSGAYATDIQGVQATGNVAPSAAVVDVVRKLADIVDGKDGNRFGRTSVYLNGLRNSVRTEETNLGDLTADANLFRARQTDPATVISLKNGGGIRDAIGAISSVGGTVTPIPPPANPRVGKAEGEVSQLDIENSLRFNNTLSLLTVTAQQLRDTMEWGVAASGTPGQFPQVSGLSFSFDATKTAMTYTRNASGVPTAIATPGERLRNLVVLYPDDSQDLVVENGVLVGDPNRTFRLVTLNFMASGGDSYYALTLGANRLDLVPAGTTLTFNTDGGEQRALADYLKAIQTFTEADRPAAEDLRIQNLSRRSDVVLAPLVRRITSPSPATEISFRTLPGRIYAIESKETIDGTWERLPLQTPGTGALKSLIDTREPRDQRYYRAVVVSN